MQSRKTLACKVEAETWTVLKGKEDTGSLKTFIKMK